MSDLPVQKEPTLEDRIDQLEADLLEIARGVNTQASLLESMVKAFDDVIKRYLFLIGKVDSPKTDEKKDA